MINHIHPPTHTHSLINNFIVFRFRVCQLLAKLLGDAVEAECIVGSQRLENVQKAMLLRLYDKVRLEMGMVASTPRGNLLWLMKYTYHGDNLLPVFVRFQW